MAKKDRKRAKVKTVYQIANFECGVACLSMILSYYGRSVNMEDLRIASNVTRDGCSADDLINAAKGYGLIGKGYKKQVFQLREVAKPCIIHWDFGHFVVLEKITRKKAFINDPAIGRMKMSVDEFAEHYTGIVLTFTPDKLFVKSKRQAKIMPLIKSRIKSEKAALTFMVLAGLILVIPGTFLPMLTRMFIDEILIKNNVSWLTIILAIIAFLYAYQMIFQYIKSYALSKLKLKLALFTNYKLISRMIKLPANFYEQRYAGELVNRVDNNNDVNTFLAGSLTEVVIDIVQAVFYLILMGYYNVTLTLIGIAGVLLNVVISFVTTKSLMGLGLKLKLDIGKNAGVISAGYSVASSIKANGLEDTYAQTVLNSYASMTDSEQKLNKVSRVLASIPPTISQIVSIIVMFIGGYMIINGGLTIGTLTAFLMLLSYFTSPIDSLLGIWRDIQDMKVNIARVEDINRAYPEKRFYVDENNIKQEKLEGFVECRHIEFGYNPSDAPLIKNLDFKCNPGSKVAIVGTSGCGKSTLAKIIGGLADPWSGQVLIDNIPINSIPQSYLTESLTTVNQNSTIFSGTIKENITLWNRNYSERDLTRAIRDAGAEEFISNLPGSYDYFLEEGGANISGGQRQMIQLARTLIKNPSVLVLDEATSSLDEITESEIMKRLTRRNCTCFIVAHRLSTVKNCDCILVMDKGRIVETGTHDELMSMNGIYRKLQSL